MISWRHRRWRRGEAEEGQALVEFAVVLPLVVMIFLGVMWFWELLQVKLKVQEAARFAAWEATAYPLHDYKKGRTALTRNFGQYQQRAILETSARYIDLDSATTVPMGSRLMMASWTPPTTMVMQYPEEKVYGGPIISLLANFAGSAIGMVSGLLYGNDNDTAKELIGGGRGALKDFMFGSLEWGFNDNGYSAAWVATYVKNEWFNVRIFGKPIFDRPGFFIKEFHGVLADSWRLNTGQNVKGDSKSPGWAKKTTMYKQLDRMYLGNKYTRGLATAKIIELQGYATDILWDAAPAGGYALFLQPYDFIAPAVVSVGYKGGSSGSGKIRIGATRGPRTFDSAPNTGAYAETLKDRGEYFMGCKEGEKLGCTHTLGQDDPFGDYLGGKKK
ncbi:MAG: pilus assembly protein [Deltaproteobacteria bacterium]|nr:pilus assembly protein [Deltaproteobacteria bacterium]